MLKLADWAISTSRLNSVWPFTFGLACCAIEMMASAAARFDMDRFGAGVFRATPRQSDLMIVSGTVTYKMGLCIERLWHQMPEPKWAIAMGACATNAGPYDAHGYHVMKGVDLIVPVSVYTPGCPPRPEALIGSLLHLQNMIKNGSDRSMRAAWERDRAKGSLESKIITETASTPPTASEPSTPVAGA
ncbi:MAG: NADH-quinone oxidoreductase subunit NuoB [Candidatus Lindowbacteria bacterium]|nr:NADH-quinone oxidoreductase subunit NuoB [Candidatus Lindowbacteria bacterium]